MLLKLTEDEIQALKTIVNRAQFSGADVEFVAQIKAKLASAKKEEDDKGTSE